MLRSSVRRKRSNIMYLGERRSKRIRVVLWSRAVIGILGSGSLAEALVEELARRQEDARSVTALAGLDELRALVIVSELDADNVEIALLAKRLAPSLRIVVRVFDPILEDYLEKTAPDIRVLSMSAVAAPAVIEAIEGAAQAHGPSITGANGSLFRDADQMLLRMLGFICALIALSSLYFTYAMNLRFVDALYFVVTTITTTGYGDITPKDMDASVKIATVVLMLLGTGSFAIVFALAADWLFARRLNRALGRIPTKWQGHYVIAGAGNISLRVAAQLKKMGLKVLVIERDPEARALYALREAGHHVLVGDATKEETLVLAGGHAARGILALTDSDANNLHIALIARAQNQKAPVMARIDSPLLCNHISQDDALNAFSPVTLAAKAFVDAALA
jgi:Trk K+ transport system NAD-binding subunit